MNSLNIDTSRLRIVVPSQSGIRQYIHVERLYKIESMHVTENASYAWQCGKCGHVI